MQFTRYIGQYLWGMLWLVFGAAAILLAISMFCMAHWVAGWMGVAVLATLSAAVAYFVTER